MFLLQKTILCFFKLCWRTKRFLLTLVSNWLRFCSYKLPVSKIIIQNIQKMMMLLPCKTGKIGYFILFKLHQFETWVGQLFPRACFIFKWNAARERKLYCPRACKCGPLSKIFFKFNFFRSFVIIWLIIF